MQGEECESTPLHAERVRSSAVRSVKNATSR